MKPLTKQVPYPDNLWYRVFGDDQPVPADADETLTLLRQAISNPVMQQILDLRFKEGKTLAEVGRIVGYSSQYVRLLTDKSIRIMIRERCHYKNGSDLAFGLEVHSSIVKGKRGVCNTCKKLIEEGTMVFVVPYYKDFYCLKYRENPVLRLYCSRECANASIAANIEQHEYSIQKRECKIKELMNEECLLEAELQCLNDYKIEPMTLIDAHDRIHKSHKQTKIAERGKLPAHIVEPLLWGRITPYYLDISAIMFIIADIKR